MEQLKQEDSKLMCERRQNKGDLHYCPGSKGFFGKSLFWSHKLHCMHKTEKEAIGLPVKLWSVSRRLWLKNHSPTHALTIKQLASWPYLSDSHDFWVGDMSLHSNSDGYRYSATTCLVDSWFWMKMKKCDVVVLKDMSLKHTQSDTSVEVDNKYVYHHRHRWS